MSEINNTKITLSLDDELIKALENAENVIRFIAGSNNIDKLNYIWEKDNKILRLTLILKSTNEEVIIKAVENGVGNTNNNYGYLRLISNNESDNVLNNGLDSILCVGKNIIEIDLTELEINADIESDIFQSFIIGPNSYYPIVNNKFTINSTEYTILDSIVADNIYKVDDNNFIINETSYFINPDAQVILNNNDGSTALVNDNKFSLSDKNYIISSKFIVELLETTENVYVSDNNKFTIEDTVFTISEDYKNITCKFEGKKEDLETGNIRYEFNIFGDTFLVTKTKNNKVIYIVKKIEGGINNTIKILDDKFTIGSNQFSITGNIDETIIVCNITLEENIFDLTDKGSYIIDNKIVYKANKIVLIDDKFSLGNENYSLSQREVVIVNKSEDSNDFEVEYYLVSNNSFTINDIIYTKYWSNKNYLIISGNYKIDDNQFRIGDSIYTINSNVDLEESIKYLEGIGIDTGSSIYLLNKDNEDTLVTKESYIKLLYKTIINLEEDNINEIYSFIDKDGQTVYRNTLFRVYNPKEVDIYLTKTKNYELVELKENVYGIGIVAGNFSIGGTIGYTDYSIINNKYNKVKTGKVRVSEIPSFQLKFIENTNIFNKDNTIISGEKLIEYTDTFNNTKKDETTYLSEELTIYFDSPGLYNEVVRCQKTINVVQAVDYNIPWQLILPETSDDIWTKFKEKEITGLNITKEIPVIVFNNPSLKKTTEIGIKTTDSNIATALGNNQFSLIYEHSLDYPSDSNPKSNFNNYFSIDTENINIKEINTTINYYEIKIPIIYKNSNISGDKWAPCSGNIQELIKVTIKLNESLELGNYSSSFYVAGRSSNIPVPKIYEDLGDDINNYSSVSPINEIKMTFLKPQNIRLIYEREEEHYWIANKNSGISINSDVKDNNKNKYIDNRLSESININVDGNIEKNNVIIFTDLTKELWEKYGINSDELNIEDWKINILLPSTSLIIKTKKQIISFWYDLNDIQKKIINDDGELSGDLGEELTVNQNDIYKLFVSSNLKTRATLGNSNSTVMFAKGEGDNLVNFYKYVDLNPASMSEGISVEFELNSGITEIKPEAFKNCIDLEKIIIPNTINTIGESAFENCINLKEIVLPSTLKKINKRAFYNCTNLLKVVIEEDNLEYIAPDSFDKSAIKTYNNIIIIGQTLLKYSKNLPESVIDIKNLVEDTKIKTIAGGAFDGCSNIISITIPGTVRYIGDNAFSGCTNLEEIFFEPVEEGTYNIPLTVGHRLDFEIRKSLLSDCSNIKRISLGRNIKYFTEIEDYKSVGDSLYSEIDWWDPTYKSIEGKIGFPNECGRDYNDGYENLDLGYTSMFRDLSSLTTIEFKNGVEVIRDLEFYGCSELSGYIELCDTIKEIGFKSFCGTKIYSIKVNKESELSYIWTKAFMNCSSLSEIDIQSSNLKKLGRLIFCNNKNLVAGNIWATNNKDLKDSETWNNLFYNVKINLTNVDEIGNGLVFDTGIYKTWSSIKYWEDLTRGLFASVLILPNSENSDSEEKKGWLIDYKAVKNYAVYPKSKGNNEHHEFYSNLVGICNDLSYNTICNQLFMFPESLKYIGSNSFKKTLGDHSTVIFTGGDSECILFRKNAFKDTSIYYVYSSMIKWRLKTTNENYDWFDLSNWCKYYTFENEFSNPLCGTTYLLSLQANRTVYVFGDNIHIGNKEEKINIPDYSFYGWTKKDENQYSIQGYVGSVGKKAFARSADYKGYLSSGLQFIKLSGVEEIKEEAFKDQTELNYVEITNSPKLRSIGDSAFVGTYWLGQQPFYKNDEKKGDNYLSYNESGIFYLSVNKNDNDNDGDYFAYAWTGKQNRVGGDFIERDFNSVLGNEFSKKINGLNINLIGFSDLENLNGNNQVEIVTNKGDKQENYFILNKSIKYIGENAFNGNPQIKKIKLPEDVEYIGDRAFNDCSNLSEISLTDKINYFGINAFGNTIIKNLRIFKHTDNTDITINNSFNNNSFEELILPNLFYWCTKVNLNSIESNPIQYSDKFYFGDGRYPGDITIEDFNEEILNINFDDKEEFNGHIKKYSLCCSPYREIVLDGNTVNTIEEYAFYNCQNLRKVTISESIVEIKDYAFYKFESEDDYLIVEFKGNIAPKISKNSFNIKNTLFIIPENSNGYNENEYTLFIKVTNISEIISGTYFNHETDNEIIIYDDSLDYKNTIKDIKVNTESKEVINNKINSIASNNILYIAIKELNTETEEKLLDTVMIKTMDSADGEEIEISVPIRYKKSETKRRELKFVNENLLLVNNSDYTVNTPIIHYSPIIPDFDIKINRGNYFSYPNINEISNIVYFGTNNISNEGEIIYEPIYKYNKFVQISGSKVTELIATIKETFDDSYKYPLDNPSCVIEIKRTESDKIEYKIYQDSKIQPGIYVKDEILNPENDIILYYDYSGTEGVDISIPISSNYTYELKDSTDIKKIESNKLVDKIIPDDTPHNYKLTQSVLVYEEPFSENKISELSVSLRKWDEPGIEINNVLGYKDNDDFGNYPIISLPTTRELYTSLKKVFDDKIIKISVLDSKNNELSSDSGVIYELIVSNKDNNDTIISLDDNNKYRSEFNLRIVIPEQNNSNDIKNIILLGKAANSLDSIKNDTVEKHTLIVSTEDSNSTEAEPIITEHRFNIQSSKDPVATLIRLDKIIQETDIELIEEPNSKSLVPNTAYIAVEKPKDELIEAEINVDFGSTGATLTILHSLDLDDIIEYSTNSNKEINQVNDYNLQIRLDSNDTFLGEEITIENNGIGKYNNEGKCEYLEDGSKIELDSNVLIKYPKNILNEDKTQNYIISKNKDVVQKEKYLESPIVVEYIYTKEDLVNGIILFNESKKEDIYKIIIDDKDFIFTVEDNIDNKYIPSSYTIEESTEYTLTVSIYLKDINNFISDAFFSDCSNLNNIILPYGISTIGKSMFKNCSNLDVVGIPYSVSSIDAQAFYDCTKLITLAIPDSISSIGNEAFSGCSQLAHIVIPNSVTEIGNGIFNGCINLYDLIIGEGISKIPYNTFTGCSKLNVIFFVHNLPEIVNQPNDKTGFDGIETLEIKYGGNEFEKEQYKSCYSKYNNISNKIILRNNSNNDAGIINLNPEFFNLLVTITVKVPSFTADSQLMSVCAFYKKNSQGEGGFDYINFNWADNGVYTDSSPGGYWYKSWDVCEKDYLRVKILKEDRRDYMTFYFHINNVGNKSLPFRAFHDLASSSNRYGGYPSYKTGYISLPNGLERIGSRSLDACGFKLLLFPRGLKNLGTASVFHNSNLKSAIFYPNGKLMQFGTSYNSKTDHEINFAYDNIKDALTNSAYTNSDWTFSVFGESKGLISIEIPEFWDNTYEGTIPAYSFYNCTNLRYVGFLGNNPNKPYYLGKCAFKNCKKLYSDIIIYYVRLYPFCFEGCNNLINLIIRYKISFEKIGNYYDYFKNSNYLSHLFVENFANSVFPENISNFVIDSTQDRKLFDLTVHTKEVCRESYRDLGFKKIGNNIEREFNISQDILKLKITQKAMPYSILKIGGIDVIPRLTGTELTRCLGIHSSGYAINSGSGDNWNTITIELNNAVEGGSIIKDEKLNLEIVKIGDSNLFPPNLKSIDSGIISSETEENLTTIRAWIKIDESYTKENNYFENNILVDNYYILLHNKNQNGDIKETWALGYVRGWTGLKIDDSNNIYTHSINSEYTVNIGNEDNPILIKRAQDENNYSYKYNPSIDVIQCEPIFEEGEWKLGEEVIINSCFNESIFNNYEYCKLNIPNGNIEFTKEGLSAIESSITSEYDNIENDGANTDFPKLKVDFKLSNTAYLDSPAKVTYSNIGIDYWKVNPTATVEEEIFVEDSTISEVFELTETYTQYIYITPKFNIELWLMDSEESNKNSEAENNGEESL